MAEPRSGDATLSGLQASSYDEHTSTELQAALSLPRVVLFSEIGSTLDAAHALATEGAPSGTLVLADAQTAGRGRMGRTWRSEPGRGIWLTLVERDVDVDALGLLSLRIGIAAARALDAFAAERVQLKWPNDLYVGGRKLAGILLEARWRESRLDWVAIGFGLNVLVPNDLATAAGLRAGVRRRDVLSALVPALRGAVKGNGTLSDAECVEFAERDVALGRRCIEPIAGIVRGIDRRGALRIETRAGVQVARSGSLIFEEDAVAQARFRAT